MNILNKAKAAMGMSVNTVLDAIDHGTEKLQDMTSSYNQRKVQFDMACLRVNIHNLTSISERLIGIDPKLSLSLTEEANAMEKNLSNIYEELGIQKPVTPQALDSEQSFKPST